MPSNKENGCDPTRCAFAHCQATRELYKGDMGTAWGQHVVTMVAPNDSTKTELHHYTGLVGQTGMSTAWENEGY